MDYETDAHTFFLGADITLLPNLGLNANGSYTFGEGSIEDFHLESMNPTGDLKLDYNVSTLNPNMPYLYDVAYLNGMDNYSDLEFSELAFTAGVNYRLNKNVGLGLNYYYNDYDDEEEYVYGDQSVTLQSLMGSVTYRF